MFGNLTDKEREQIVSDVEFHKEASKVDMDAILEATDKCFINDLIHIQNLKNKVCRQAQIQIIPFSADDFRRICTLPREEERREELSKVLSEKHNGVLKMSDNKIQNDEAKVENFISTVQNRVVKKATQDIFNTVIDLDSMKDICNDISADIIVDLENASFMTTQLGLSKEQKDRIKQVIPDIVNKAKGRYIEKLETDKRTKFIVETVATACHNILEQLLSSIASEINRGAILNSVAKSADTKNMDYNKIELHYSKQAGDITIPTKGIFLSTNCVEAIQNSMDIRTRSTNGNVEISNTKKEVAEEE